MLQQNSPPVFHHRTDLPRRPAPCVLCLTPPCPFLSSICLCLTRRTADIPGSHDCKGSLSVQSLLSFVLVLFLLAPSSRYPNNSRPRAPRTPSLHINAPCSFLSQESPSGLSSSTEHTFSNGKPDALTAMLTGLVLFYFVLCVMMQTEPKANFL